MPSLQVLRWLLVPSLKGVEKFVIDPETEKERIQSFWAENPNLINEASSEPGTLSFFQEVDASRKASHWPLYEIVPFAETSGLQVLEVGCGLGTDAVEFARSGADYTGIDLTQPAVRLTKQKLEAYSLQGTTKQADAEDLPFDDESFDVVYSWGVIHHTPDTDRCVKEMYRVLRPGGRIILMLYHKNGWLYYRICLHWALLSLLRFNTVAMIAHQLFGADYEKINRWNELYRLDKEQAFQRLVARETDEMESGVNPHSKYYSRRDMYRLLADFENVQVTCAHWLEMPVVERLLGQQRYRQLIRWFGSFNGQGIYAIAKKPG